MRRLAVLLPLPMLAACGAGAGASPHADTAPKPRAAIRILAPSPARTISARPLRGRLSAVVRASGSAAAGQQLTLRGVCGGLDCEGITFADSRGRWRTRLELDTPRGRRTVRLVVGYSAPAPAERPATVTLRFRRLVLAPAAPPPAPPSTIAPPSGGEVAAGTATPYAGPRTMIVIGDSLAVGMAQALQADLPGWAVPVDGRVGRPLAEGMQILSETRLPSGSRGAHAILAFSLFTNDSPTDVDALEAAVRESVSRLGAHGCAIWATIARPPFGGVGYAAANQRLEALEQDPSLAGRLLIVPWKAQYDRHPTWRAGDGVHATPTGYAARARMYAVAARDCAA